MHEAQLAALRACLERAPHRTERPKSDAQLNWEAIQEQQAEEHAHDRRHPTSSWDADRLAERRAP